MKLKYVRWLKTARYILRRYLDANCDVYAASLTLDTLLSLVPFLATALALFAAVPEWQHFISGAEDKLLNELIFDTGDNVAVYLQQARDHAAAVSVIGAIFLILISIKLLYSLNQAFQAMLSARIRQKTIFELALSCLAWLLVPILIGLGLVLSSLVSFPLSVSLNLPTPLLKGILYLLPIVLDTLGFTFLYVVAPLFVVPFKNAAFGAFCAALLFELSKALFGLYIVYFPSYAKIYGALAAIPLFLLWLYVCWQIALLGALIAQGLSYSERYRSKAMLDGFTHAFCWLGYLREAERAGESLTLTALIEKDPVRYQVEPEAMLEKLKALKLITIGKKGRYHLAQNIDHLTLYDYTCLFPWKVPEAAHLKKLNFSWKAQLIAEIVPLNQQQKKSLHAKVGEVYDDTNKNLLK